MNCSKEPIRKNDSDWASVMHSGRWEVMIYSMSIGWN